MRQHATATRDQSDEAGVAGGPKTTAGKAAAGKRRLRQGRRGSATPAGRQGHRRSRSRPVKRCQPGPRPGGRSRSPSRRRARGRRHRLRRVAANQEHQAGASEPTPDKIPGIVHKTCHRAATTKTGVITYDRVAAGRRRAQPDWQTAWATSTDAPIANENAVHSLEHGAVWITYKPGLPADQVDMLTKLVSRQAATC